MNLAEYFAMHRPRPRYAFGDRVAGVYQGVPWVGTAYTDNLRNEAEGVKVSVHLDLPMRVGSEWLTHIRVSYRDIKGIRT